MMTTDHNSFTGDNSSRLWSHETLTDDEIEQKPNLSQGVGYGDIRSGDCVCAGVS